MKLSTKGRYAVMALADLSMNSSDATPVALAGIARRQEISLSYLEQIFAKLRRAGLVRSARGPGGGYILAKTTAQITIAEIMKAVGGAAISGRKSHGGPYGCCRPSGCLTHALWENLSQHIESYLSTVTLEDAISGMGQTAKVLPLAAD